MKDIVISMVMGLFLMPIFIWFMLFLSGNTITDTEKQFLKNVTSLKAECEMTLPRTEHCVLQFVPAQQKG